MAYEPGHSSRSSFSITNSVTAVRVSVQKPFATVRNCGLEVPVRELRHGDVGRQPLVEVGPERLRHGHEEAHPVDVGDREEVRAEAARRPRPQVAFLVHVVADVDVTGGDHAVEGRDDGAEAQERLEVPDVLLGGLVLGLGDPRLGLLDRDLLLGAPRATARIAAKRLAVSSASSQRAPAGPRRPREPGGIAPQRGRADPRQDVALVDLRAVVLVPGVDVAGDLRVDRSPGTTPRCCRAA